MESHEEEPFVSAVETAGPLGRALGRSEEVQDKVEQAAADLSSVNAVLKNEIGAGAALAQIERALEQSEAVEVRVHEAAEDLSVINDALAEEIDARHDLERQLSDSNASLLESRVQERSSRHDALHDALTGLANMTLFNDRLANALGQAQRHGRRLAVLFIDLDEFKTVNDTHGHHIGDRVLQMAAQCLQACLRGGETLSRRSGDEFVILMPDIFDQSDPTVLADRILSTLSESCSIDGLTFVVDASIGIATYPEDGRTPHELLRKADVAMYAAKQRRASQL